MGEANQRLGRQVEKHRAKTRDGQHVGTDGWFDVEGSDGTPVEVKSTQKEVTVNWDGQGKTRPGRYQIVKENHQNLVDHGGEYDFVLRDGEGNEIETRTMTAAEVDELIRERGREWPENSKLKLSHRDIHQ